MNTEYSHTAIQLNVYGPNSVYPTKVNVKEGATIYAGAGATCAVQLEGTGAEQFHCMISLLGGQIVLQHCGTGGRTSVNGENVENEIVLQLGDTIVVGEHQIVISESVVHDVDSENCEPENGEREYDQSQTGDAEFDVASMTQVSIDSQKSTDGLETDDAAMSSDEDAWMEVESDRKSEQGEELIDDEELWFDDAEDEDSVSIEVHNLMKDEMELLRSEVEYLQTEMAAKDEEIANHELTSPEPVDDNDTLKLVARLEELLDELKHSDERVHALEDLLRLSEEANLAEQEERAQIESWLNEIESRVCHRESELEAEIASLKKKLKSANGRQAKAESQLKKLLAKKQTGTKSDSKSETPGNVASIDVDQLKQQLAQMERLLEASKQESMELASEITDLKKADPNKPDVQALEQKLIELELETSRERASIARERAEFESRIEQVERVERKNPKVDESDYRFAAMRDHLREIHEEEKMMKLQKQQNSLSGRISRLLKRN